MSDDDISQALIDTPGIDPRTMLRLSVPLMHFGTLVRDRTARDYNEVLLDHERLVRELDVALNGEANAAKQARLVDIVTQVKNHHADLMEAYRALQNTLLVVPDGQFKFKKEMTEWLSKKLLSD